MLSNLVNNLPAVLVLLPLVTRGRARRGAGRADRGEHRAEPDLRRLAGEPVVAQAWYIGTGDMKAGFGEFSRVGLMHHTRSC